MAPKAPSSPQFTRKTPFLPTIAIGVITALALAPIGSVQASNYTWNGGSNTWSGHWLLGSSQGAGSATPTSADTANFNNGANAATVSLGGPQSITSITLAAGQTGAVTLQGGGSNQVLSLGGTSSVITVTAGAGPLTIGSTTSGQNVTVDLTSNSAWANNGTNIFTVNNGITNVTGGSSPFTLTINGSGAGGTALNGVISDSGTAGGTTALTISTTGGVTTLSGANTYTGGTTITKGTLDITGSGTLGSTSGTLSMTGAANTTLDLGGTSQTVGAVTLGGVTNTIQNGSLTGSSYSITSGTSIVNANLLGAGATLSVNTTGALTLGGTNTFGGGTTLTTGTLKLNSSTALGTGGIALNGGTIDNISNTAFTSTASASLGATSLSVGSASETTANSNITFSGTTAYATSLAKTITFNGSGMTLNLGGTLQNNVDAADTLTVTGGGNTLVLGGLVLDTSGTTARNQIIAGTGNVTISGVVSNGASTGTQSLKYSGSGTLTLNGANTYTGTTVLITGTLVAGASSTITSGTITNGALGTGILAMSGGTTLLDNGTNITIANSVTTTTSATFGTTGGGSLTFDGTTLGTQATFGLALNPTFTVNNLTTIADVVSGTDSLTLAGTGTLVLSGANTYSGVTKASSGTLKINNNLALQSSIYDSSGAGTFLFGAAATTPTMDGIIGGGTINYGSATALTITGAAGVTNVYSGVISDGAVGMTLTKTGALTGTQTLNGNNTYTGLTSVLSGRLNLGGNNTAATGGITVNGGGVGVANDLALGTGALTLTSGTLSNYDTVSHTESNNPTITFNGTAFTIGSTGSSNLNLGTGAVSVVLSATTGSDIINLTLGGTNVTTTLGNVTIQNSQAGVTGTLTVAGAGNTLAIGSLVSASALKINGTSGSQPNITINGAISGSTIADASVGTYYLTFGGYTGTVTLSGSSSYTGGTNLTTGGTVILNSANALGSSTGQLGLGANGGNVTTLDLNGNNLGVGYVSTGATTVITNNGAATTATLTLGNGNFASTTSTIASNITDGTGTISLVKTGTGVLKLVGTNSFSGGLVINSTGTVALESLTALGTASANNVISLSNGGVLESNTAASFDFGSTRTITLGTGGGEILASLTATGTTTVDQVVQGSGPLTLDTGGSNGTLLISGSNTFSGGTTLQGSSNAVFVLALANNNALGTGTLTLTGNSNNRIIQAFGGSITLPNAVNISSGTNYTIGGSNDLTFNNLVTNNTGVAILTISNTGNTTFAGGLQLTTGAAETVEILGSSNATISGTISQDGANAGTLDYYGTGTLTLSGSNTFTGKLFVGSAGASGTAGGTVLLTNNGAAGLGSGVGSGITVNTGTLGLGNTLALSNNVTTTYAGSLSLSNTGANNLGALRSISGVNTWAGTGTVSLSADSSVRADAGATLVIANSGGLNLGANLKLDGPGTINITNVITGGSGVRVIDQIGTGTTTLSGANNYISSTEVDAGTLSVSNIVVSGGTSNIGNSTGSVLFGGTGTLAYTGGNANYTRGFSVQGGTAGELDVTNSATTLTVSGFGIQANNGGTFTFGGPGNALVSGTITNGAGTPLSLIKNGSGLVTLSGPNSYTGTTTVNTGTLQLAQEVSLYNNTSSSWTNTNITVAGGAVLAFNVGGTGEFTTSDIATLLGTSGSQLGVGTASTGLQSNSYLGFDTTNASGGNFTPTNVIANTTGTVHSIGLIKLGTNTLTLNLANTYSGGTIVTAGTLNVTSSGTIGATTGTLTVNNLNTGAGTAVILNLAPGVNTTVGSLSGTLGTPSSGSNTATINNGGAGENFTVNQTTSNTYAGVIAGAGNFTLGSLSTSTLTLSGLNTYTGTTSINAGTLSANTVGTGATAQSLGKGSVLNLGVASTSSTDKLIYTGGTGTFDKTINTLGTGTNTIQNSGTGTLTLSGSIVKNGTKLTLMGTGGLINVTGTISGSSSGSDLIIDTGTTTLSAANTYNGPTYIRDNATLNANVTGALPTGTRTDVVMDDTGTGTSTLALGANQVAASLTGATSSTVNLNGNNLTVGSTTDAATFAGVISGGAGTFTKDGTGTQTLSGNSANTYTGVTSVNGGELDLNKSSGVAVAGNVAVGNGTGATDADVLKLLASNQIATTGTVTVNKDGRLALNSFSNTVAALASSGGDITSVTPGGNLTVSSAPGFSGTGTSTIGAGATVTSSSTATLASSSNLAINGTLADSLAMASSSSLSGTGSVGAVSLAGSNTLSSSSTLTTSGLSVSGSGNAISAGTVSGGGTINSGGTLSVGSGSTLSGALGVSNGGTLKGTGTVGATTVSGGGSIALANGTSSETLTVGTLSIGNAGTPSALSFDIGSTLGTTDIIADTGALTLSGTSGTTITIANATGVSTLTNGNYALITYGGTLTGSVANLGLSSSTLDGKNLSLSQGIIGGQNAIILTVGATATPTSYTLATTAGASRIMNGQSTTLTTTITNVGTGTADTLNYTGLGATATTVSNATTSGGPLANGGGTGSNSGQIFTGSVAGANTITPTGSGTNATLGGSATQTGTTTATVNVLNNRTETASSVALGRVLVNGTTGSQTTTITSPTGQDGSLTRTTLGGSAQASTVTNGTVTLASGTAYQFGGANDATNSTTRGVTGVFTTAGNQSGTANFTPTGEGLTGESVNPIGVAYTADAVNQRTFSVGTSPVALGRFLLTSTPTGSTAITSTGLNVVTGNASLGSFSSVNGLSLTTGDATAFNGATSSQTANYSVGGTASGAGNFSGSFSSTVSAELGSIAPVTVAVTGDAVNQRTFSVGTSPVALGRFLLTSTPTGSTAITSTGLNAVTGNASLGSFSSVNGLSLTTGDATAFNGAASSQTANYTVGGTASGAGNFSGSFSSTVSAELGSIAPVTVAVTGDAVNQRTFSVGTSPVALGRFLISGSPTGSTAITSTGLNAVTGNASLGSFSSVNGLSLTTGDATAFNGAASSQTANYSVGGTASSAGNFSGSFSSTVSAELGSIAPVTVAVTGDAVNQRTFSVGTSPVALGRFLITSSPTGSTAITSTGLNAVTGNASLGSFSSVNGLSLTTGDATAFNGATSSQTANYSIGGTASSAGSFSGNFSSTVSAELGSIAPVTVAVTGDAVNQRSFSVTGTPIALGRYLVGTTPSGSVAVSSTGLNDTTGNASLGAFNSVDGLTLTTTDPTAFNGATSSQTANYALGGTATTGNFSGTFSSTVSAEFGSIAPVTVAITADAVNQRSFSVGTSPVALGRFLISSSPTGSTAITSTGLNNVTANASLGSFSSVNGLSLTTGDATAFNGATSSQTANYSVGGTASSAGSFSGSFSSTVGAELGSIAPVTVAVTGDAVNQRTFSVGTSPVALGRFLISSSPTGSTAITSTGLNDTTGNASLGSFSSVNGLNLTTGDSTAFNGGTSSQTANYSVGGTAASAGSFSGSFSSTVGAELGSIAPVTVAVTGDAVNQRSFSVGTSPVALGRFLITSSPTGSTAVTSTGLNDVTGNASLGSFSSVNGLSLTTGDSTAFNGATSSQTANYSVGGTASSAGSFSGSFSSTVGAELGSIAPVTVAVTGDAVNQRAFSVGTSPVALGRFLITSSPTGSTAITSTGLNDTTGNASLGSFSSVNGLSLTTGDSTAFNGGSSSQTANYAVGGTAASAGSFSGSFSSTVGAELGSIAPVTVAVTGDAVNQRSFSVTGTPVALGRYLVGTTPSGSVAVSSTGLNDTTGNASLGAFNSVDGLTLTTTDPTAFNGATSSQTATYALGGTATTGNFSGTFSSTVTAELGSIAPVTVAITADAVNQRTFSVSTSPVALGRFIATATPSGSTSVTSTGLNDVTANASLGTFSTVNGLGLTTGDSTTFNGASSSQTANYAVNGTASGLGSFSGTFSSTVSAELGSIAPVTVAVTGDAVTQRVVNTGAVTDLGFVHSGAAVSATANAFSSTGTHDTTTDVTVAGGDGTTTSNGVTLSGSSTSFNGPNGSSINGSTQTFGGNLTSGSGGTTTGSFNLGVTGEGLTGEGSYSDVNVAYTSFVYTGQGVWNTNGGGSWGAVSETPANWTANGGTPGLDANFTSTDSAFFGSVTTSGTANVTLDGDNPSLNAITFNNGSASYNIGQGTGTGSITLNGGLADATVTNLGGIHEISAPVHLATSADVNVSSGQQLTLSGTLSGPGGLNTTTGSGTTIITGDNSYAGGTAVNAGVLRLSNSSGSATGSGALSVGAGAVLAGSGTSNSSGLSITGDSSTRATVLVGYNNGLDTNTTNVMTLTAPTASLGSARLEFNINANTPGQGTELAIANTAVTFNTVGTLNTQLALNIEGNSFIAAFTPYVLVAGTGTTIMGTGTSALTATATSGQFTGLDTFINSKGQDQIVTGSTKNLQLTFNDPAQAAYYAQSYLFIVNHDGVDDIEVEVVPEPGTWALMLGGLALLVFWQRRKNKS